MGRVLTQLSELFSQYKSLIELASTIIVTIATIVLAIVTARYVRLTKLMLVEMKSTRDPSVVVDFEFPDRRGRLSIRNVGQSPAINLQFILEEDAPWLKSAGKERGLHSLSVLKKGINYMPPQRELKYMLGLLDWGKIEKEGGVIRIRIIYNNEFGKSFEREIVYDLAQYHQVLCESFQDPSVKIANAIRRVELSHSTEKLFRNFSLPSKKECPICGENIPQKAKKCSKCGEFIENLSTSGKKDSTK